MKTEMTNIQKKDIQIALADYCARYGGQNRASKILEGVSVGTISQMVNGNWENIWAVTDSSKIASVVNN